MKMRTRPLLGMIEEQGSIVDMRESIVKGIWKSRPNWSMEGRAEWERKRREREEERSRSGAKSRTKKGIKRTCSQNG